MKFSKLVKAQAVFENASSTFGARSFNFVSEQNPTQNGATWIAEGFNNISGKLVKRIFLSPGTLFINGTGYGSTSYANLAAFTISIKDIYGRLVIDRLPLTALDLRRGKFFTQQFSFIPDFSQSYISMPGTLASLSSGFNFCFDIAYNREETNQRKQTFEKLNA